MNMYRIPPGDVVDAGHLAELDANDPLAKWREQFVLPPGIAYFDGMSLGALPRVASERVVKLVHDEWGHGLIRSWNDAGWIEMPHRLGQRIAPLLNASGDEVIVADSTSVNLFKLLVAGIRLNPQRNVILIESSNFPTDVYVARGVEQLHPDVEVRLVRAEQFDSALDDRVAVAMMTHVDYKTSQMMDMADITARAQRVGALMLWDLSHSTGAVPIDLHGCNVDLAVGCGYKYLNGGPGAPSFMFVAERHQSRFDQPITAWMGHANPFEFSLDYAPAAGMRRALSGTPMVVSAGVLEASLEVWSDVDLTLVREKSLLMSELFIRMVEQQTGESDLSLASPREATRRGSHLAFRHPQGYAVMQALIDRGVIGDFRDPDLMRFGFTPLYMTFADVGKAVAELVDVVTSNAWDQPRFRQRSKVT